MPGQGVSSVNNCMVVQIWNIGHLTNHSANIFSNKKYLWAYFYFFLTMSRSCCVLLSLLFISQLNYAGINLIKSLLAYSGLTPSLSCSAIRKCILWPFIARLHCIFTSPVTAPLVSDSFKYVILTIFLMFSSTYCCIGKSCGLPDTNVYYFVAVTLVYPVASFLPSNLRNLLFPHLPD